MPLKFIKHKLNTVKQKCWKMEKDSLSMSDTSRERLVKYIKTKIYKQYMAKQKRITNEEMKDGTTSENGLDSTIFTVLRIAIPKSTSGTVSSVVARAVTLFGNLNFIHKN